MFGRTVGAAVTAAALGFALIGCSQPEGAREGSGRSGAQQGGAGQGEPASDAGKVSYGMGYALGGAVQGQIPGEVDNDQLLAGVRDALNGDERRVSDDAFRSALANVREKAQDRARATAEENLAKAQAFLEENAKREGVAVTESGLQYKELAAGDGDGRSPAAQDTVVVHYTGKLADGTTFDSSRERGEPAQFRLDEVLPGWTEGVQMMEVGDRWRLWLPPDLGYGAQGAGQAIPPNSALVFDVELLDVQEAAASDGEDASGGGASDASDASDEGDAGDAGADG